MTGVQTCALPICDISLTNSAGIYGESIADHVLAGVLYFLRSFDVAGTLQRRTEWNSAIFGTDAAPIREVNEVRVLVVGAGGIGSEVARRFSALGATVTGTRRNPAKGVPEGLHRVVGADALDAELPSADVLVLTTPLTPETRTLLDARRLALLPPGAIVSNIGRGALIDETALVADLKSGRLRGAALDGELVLRAIDEVPILAVLGALAEGETVIRGAAELRVKESDRLAQMAVGLRAIGAQVEELPDGLRIEGGKLRGGAVIDAALDHRIALAFSVAALACEEPCVIEGAEWADVSFPGFFALLRQLGAEVELES